MIALLDKCLSKLQEDQDLLFVEYGSPELKLLEPRVLILVLLLGSLGLFGSILRDQLLHVALYQQDHLLLETVWAEMDLIGRHLQDFSCDLISFLPQFVDKAVDFLLAVQSWVRFHDVFFPGVQGCHR